MPYERAVLGEAWNEAPRGKWGGDVTISMSVRDLLAEVVEIHSNPDGYGYHECDVEPCGWCESARAHIADMGRAAAHECG